MKEKENMSEDKNTWVPRGTIGNPTYEARLAQFASSKTFKGWQKF
jgi:hypothetical protein